MATLRLQPVTTSTTAQGTVGGILTVASTTGITRRAVLYVSNSDGWVLEVDRVIDATHLQARHTGFVASTPEKPGIFNRTDLTVIPNGATVIMPEQWVSDLQNDDIPTSLALPTK